MDSAEQAPYILEEQVGFLLRRATQRHTALFAERMGDITPTQWAALAKLHQMGPVSQNRLGRMTAMDGATIKGVVDRLTARGLLCAQADRGDARRRVLALTPQAEALIATQLPLAREITRETLAPLSAAEQDRLLSLLHKLR